MSGDVLKSKLITWLRIDPPSLISLEPKLILTKTKSSELLNIGVIDLVMSLIGENADTINDSGLVFLFLPQLVSIERESFPTGMVKFHFWQISSLTVLTVLNKLEFVFEVFGAAIQLAESFIDDNF